MEGKPGWDRLKAFLEGPLRRDLKNLALLDVSMVDRTSAEGEATVVTLRLFFRERGYVRGAERLEDPGMKARVLARWMGVADTEPVPASLSFLAGDRVDASLRAAWWSPVIRRLWKERASESPELPASESEDEQAEDLFGHLVADLVDLSGFSQRREVVEVSLACGVAPTETNGEWRATEGRVAWSAAALRHRSVTGLLRHATWAVPDEETQTVRFGGVVLAGAPLAFYVVWRSMLSAENRSRWDAAVAALKPGESLVPAIWAIRLAGDEGQDPAMPGRDVLLQALKAAK